MLEKSSVLMILLVGTGSLVGISSIYTPANVEAQPNTQILQPSPQSQLTPADKQLLDRLFPAIIQRIDGKTLLDKVDPKTLAKKVLPYLDISATVNRRVGTSSILNVQDVARDLGLTGAEVRGSTAKCNPGEIAVSGGFSFQSDPEDSYVSSVAPNAQNGWYAGAQMGDNGKIQAHATCLTVKVALKDLPSYSTETLKRMSEMGRPLVELQKQQLQQPQPSQPPAGPIVR